MWNTAIELAYLNGIEMKNDLSLFYHYLFLNRLNRCRKNAIIKMPWFFFYHSLHTHAVEKFKIPLIYRKKIELHFNWSQRQWFEKTCPPPGILWTNIPVINGTVQESGEEEIQVLGREQSQVSHRVHPVSLFFWSSKASPQNKSLENVKERK